MNKGVKLILAVVVLGALIAAWFGVRSLNDKGEEPEDTTSLLFVVETDPAQLTSLEYEINGTIYTFAYAEGKWINPSDVHMPLDQTAVTGIASALTTVACNRMISETGAGSAEYGLDDPEYRITLKYSDGSAVEYYIGDQNIHTTDYYLTVKGSDAVYGVNQAILQYCSKSYGDMLALDEIRDIAADKVDKLVCETAGGTVTLEKLVRVETTDKENGETEETRVTCYVLINEAGEKTELDAENGGEIVDGVLNPVIIECADYYAEEAELAAYGLDKAVKLTVHYTEELEISTENSSSGKVKTPMQYVITFGFIKNAEGADTAYMRLPDSDMVFKVDVSAFASLF